MKKIDNKLEELKGKNPFLVPDGYMENLTTQIMSQLPDQPAETAKTVTMMDRVRPWLYMAAAFVGLLLFFRALMGITAPDENTMGTDSLLVHTEISDSLYADNEFYDEEDDYLEYIENTYTGYILAEEMAFSE